MEVDPDRVAAAPLSPLSGEGWRHLSPRHDPLSGEGARLNGGLRSEIGLGLELLTGPDWTACQELGETAHALGVQAILSPSAAGVDDVLALFVQHIGLGTIEPTLVEVWHSVADLEKQ